MSPKKYLGKLPKYKKTWVKERSTYGFSDDDYSVYLIFDELKMTNYVEVVTRRIPQKIGSYPSDEVYFFELFKYLKKYQGNFPIKIRRDDQMAKYIKSHLLQKHNKQLKKDKIIFLSDYSKLINNCFDILHQNSFTHISLVIQKKLGYKYYENIIYT